MTGHATTHVDYGQVAAVIGIIVAILIVKKIPGMISALLKTFFKELLLVYIWRHFSGAHYHGRRVTDATWWSHGSDTKRHSFERGGFMDRWEHKPRGHRALWRRAGDLAFIGLVYGLITDFTVTVHAVESLIVYGLVVAYFVIEVKVRLRVHNRHLVNPIVKSIAHYLRLSPHAVRKMVHIKPENVTDDGEIGYFGPLPDHLTPGLDQQAGIARIIDAHLPVDSEMEWKFEQAPRIGVVMASQKPPDVVLWADMLSEMAKCAKGEVVLGRDKAKQPYLASLTDQEDPHWGFDCAPKYGKSNFIGVIMAQIFHQDPQAQAVVIDPKRSSLLDFTGSDHIPGKPLLKGVTLANDPRNPEKMWSAVQKSRAIFERRSEKYELDRTRKFPCFLLFIDELNQFADIIKAMWNKMKFEDGRLQKDMRQGLAGPWPGWDDIMTILQMGRFVNMHIIVCSQDFRDDSFGGRGGRNYLGFKGMAGFNPSQWDKFMQTKPTPLMQNHTGRWIFSDGSPGDQWVQTVYADAVNSRLAYEYASKDRHLFTDNDGDDVTVSDAEQAALSSVTEPLGLSYYLSSIGQSTDIQQDDVAGSDHRRVIAGDREAADFLGYKTGTFKQARHRASLDDGPGIPGEFRKGRTPCWYEEDLLAWQASRPGTGDKKRAPLRLVRDDETEAKEN